MDRQLSLSPTYQETRLFNIPTNSTWKVLCKYTVKVHNQKGPVELNKYRVNTSIAWIDLTDAFVF